MASTRKPRSDSRLKMLPEEVQEDVGSRLGEPGYTLDMAAERFAAEHGVDTSRSAVHEWYRWWRLQRRLSAAQERAAEMVERLAADGVDTAALADAGDAIFLAEAMESGDERAYAMIRGTMIRRQALDNEAAKLRQRVREYEEAQAAAKAALEDVVKSGDGGLTPETLRRIEEAAGLL